MSTEPGSVSPQECAKLITSDSPMHAAVPATAHQKGAWNATKATRKLLR